MINISEQIKSTIGDEIYKNLNQVNKFISSNYFYDAYGSQLFEEISQLDEYYVTRVEMEIMKSQLANFSSIKSKKLLVIELGSGSTAKIRCLLDCFKNIQTYLPIDVSGDYIQAQAEELAKDYKDINIEILVANYTKHFVLPSLQNDFEEILVYYPGSSIGNFEPMQAKVILQRIVNLIMESYPELPIKLLIGVDLIKDTKVLNQAYNDAKGITAKFNLNILSNLNNIAGTNFDLNNWSHYAFYNSREQRIEMHLISNQAQKIKVNDKEIPVLQGENIRTEYSYKYSIEDFSRLFKPVFKLEKCITDANNYFGLFLFALNK